MWSMLLPQGLLAWRERRRALRDLGRMQVRENLALELEEANPVHRALTSLRAGDPAAAGRYWEEAMANCPGFALSSRDALEVLLGLQRFDEADELTLKGRRREPREIYYASGYALVAERRGDMEEAARRWAWLRRKFPGSWMGYVNGGRCLVSLGQLDAAEALQKKAARLIPDNSSVWREWAETAERRQDWPAMVERWRVVYERLGDPHGVLGMVRGLEKLGRVAEADQLLSDTLARHPSLSDILAARAELAHRSGDPERAASLWAEARQLFPGIPRAYQAEISLLREMGRHADAEPIALTGARRFPGEAWPAAEYALLAHERQDWEAAAERWAALREQWPNREDGYRLGAEALAALGREEEAAQLRSAQPT